MQQTLLQIVQDILSSMDSDQVNSINDTTEAFQVAVCVKTVYNDIIARSDIRAVKSLFNLISATTALPTIMEVPDYVTNIEWIQYDMITSGQTIRNWQFVQYKQPMDFIYLVQNYANATTAPATAVNFTYTTANGDSIDLYALNNIAPTFWTSFDDENVVFDSYDNSVDTTNLVKTKSLGYGQQTVSFQMLDSYFPAFLEDYQYQLLFNESKALAWAELKQTAHAKAEQEARKQWVHLTKTKTTTPEHVPAISRLPNYGRSGRYRDSTDVILKAMKVGGP